MSHVSASPRHVEQRLYMRHEQRDRFATYNCVRQSTVVTDIPRLLCSTPVKVCLCRPRLLCTLTAEDDTVGLR